jgi:hypothetical protein
VKRIVTRTLHDLGYALVPTRGVAERFGYGWRPAATAAFPFALLVLFLTWSGWLYPLRPDAVGAVGHPVTADPAFAGAWGGPTLLGAWFVHAMVALGMQVICMAVIRRLTGRATTGAV